MGEGGPERTCVVGRTRHPRDELVRLAASPDGEVVVDLKGTLPGRGVWVLPDAQRLERFARARARIARELGVERVPDDLPEQIRAAFVGAAQHGLSLARAAGVLVAGHDLVISGLRSGRVVDVVFADDASPRTVRSVEAAVLDDDVGVHHIGLDAAALGARIGRGATAVVGVQPGPASAHLRRQLHRLARLG